MVFAGFVPGQMESLLPNSSPRDFSVFGFPRKAGSRDNRFGPAASAKGGQAEREQHYLMPLHHRDRLAITVVVVVSVSLRIVARYSPCAIHSNTLAIRFMGTQFIPPRWLYTVDFPRYEV